MRSLDEKMIKRQTIYTFGYPKSGTTWLARLLGDALNSPVGSIVPEEDDKCIATEGQNRPGPYYIRHGHAMPVEDGDGLVPDRFSFAYKHLTDERVVILIRDPRDVAVSAAHHWGMGLERTLHCMGRGEWPLTHGGGWCEWVKRWRHVTPSVDILPLVLHYEKINRNPLRFLDAALFDLYVPRPSNQKLSEAIDRQSFTARQAYTKQHGGNLNYGKEFQLRFLRKGIIGDWKNNFTPLHRRLAERYFGETMQELDHTKGEDWVNE